MFNARELMRFFTRFTDEIFAALVAFIFIAEAVKAIFQPFVNDDSSDATALLALGLALGTLALAQG